MNLKEYINWTKTINDYKTAPNVADTNAWGFERHGRVIVPEIQIKNAKEGDEGYWHFRNDTLNEWARKIWSNLQCVEAKIQIQKPNQICHPHLDFLGEYLEKISKLHPNILELEHSLDKPAIDVWRMFVAIDDHIPGQIFSIINKEWIWRACDCIRLNNWRALHWTKNTSKVDRAIIKITGINLN